MFQVLSTFIIKTFPKQPFYSAVRKEQCTAPFPEHPAHNLPSAKIWQKCKDQVNRYYCYLFIIYSFQVLAKFIIKTFPKQLFYSAVRKEQCAASFVEHSDHNFPSAKIRQKCNVQVSCSKYWQNLSLRLSQSSCFKALYESSHEQVIS